MKKKIINKIYDIFDYTIIPIMYDNYLKFETDKSVFCYLVTCFLYKNDKMIINYVNKYLIKNLDKDLLNSVYNLLSDTPYSKFIEDIYIKADIDFMFIYHTYYKIYFDKLKYKFSKEKTDSFSFSFSFTNGPDAIKYKDPSKSFNSILSVINEIYNLKNNKNNTNTFNIPSIIKVEDKDNTIKYLVESIPRKVLNGSNKDKYEDIDKIKNIKRIMQYSIDTKIYNIDSKEDEYTIYDIANILYEENKNVIAYMINMIKKNSPNISETISNIELFFTFSSGKIVRTEQKKIIEHMIQNYKL
jgi:hypothetical protein